MRQPEKGLAGGDTSYVLRWTASGKLPQCILVDDECNRLVKSQGFKPL